MDMQEENKKSDSKMRLNTSIQKNEKNELKAGEKAGKAQEKLDKKREKSIKNADPAVKKRKKVIRRIIILVLIALVVGLFIFSKMQSANAGTPVTTVEATTGTVQQTLSTSGTVKSNTTKQYFAGVAVPITTVNVKVGDAVKKGDILFAYDEDQIENQIKIQQSTMSADAGSYSGSKTGTSGGTYSGSKSKNSGSSKKSSYYDGYDDGYDDVYMDGDYDYDRYDRDPDYADGVDDALDEFDGDW